MALLELVLPLRQPAELAHGILERGQIAALVEIQLPARQVAFHVVPARHCYRDLEILPAQRAPGDGLESGRRLVLAVRKNRGRARESQRERGEESAACHRRGPSPGESRPSASVASRFAPWGGNSLNHNAVGRNDGHARALREKAV